MPFFPNQNWSPDKDRPLLFIDLEMTGLDSSIHEIVEVAALLVSPIDFEITNSYYTKVTPEHIQSADPEALKVINYDPKAWKEAITLREMLQDLIKLAPQVILAGWSVNTDYEFLLRNLEREQLPYFFDNYLVEVWTMAYVHFHFDPAIPKTNLQNICKSLNIAIDRHKPDSDIRATYEIFKRLVSLPLHDSIR